MDELDFTAARRGTYGTALLFLTLGLGLMVLASGLSTPLSIALGLVSLALGGLALGYSTYEVNALALLLHDHAPVELDVDWKDDPHAFAKEVEALKRRA